MPATPIKPSVKVKYTLMQILYVLTRISFRIFIKGGGGGIKVTITDLRGGEDYSNTLVLPSLTSFVWAKDPCTIIQPGHCCNVCVH